MSEDACFGVSCCLCASIRMLMMTGTYSLDRQICVYLGRPFSIPEESIRTPFPTELEDSLIANQPEGLPPVTPQNHSGKKSSKTIANFMFAIRRLQSEMQTVLYQGGELPRR